MSELDVLEEGIIRGAQGCGGSGPLKEDKKAEGKLKCVPAPWTGEPPSGWQPN